MNLYAQKQKASRQTTSHPARPSEAQFARGHDPNSILQLHRTIGNQAVQRMFGENSEAKKEHFTDIGTPRTGNGGRAGHAFETGGIGYSGGKLGAPLPEQGPWITMGGGGSATPVPTGHPTPPPATPAPTPAPTPPPAATPPKLSKKTVSGPTGSDCGGFKWVVQYELDKKTTKGGWVVQRVDLPFDIKDCGGKAIDPAKRSWFLPSWYPYWEAWQINKDQQVTTYAEKGDFEDDTFATSSPGNDTKGSVTEKGTAEFYDGLTLPSSFKVTNKAPMWILPTTNSAPTLTGGTGAISHNLTATWDCCSKDAKATKDTKITTV
jgi:hypothetical protein